MTLTLVNVASIIGKERGCGITLINGSPDHYVIKIVVKWFNNKHLETAQRMPSGRKENWGENYVKHKQEDLYKIPAGLICEILVSLVD